MTSETVCPYCGTPANIRNRNNRRITCKCQRLHKYGDVNGKTYTVLYKKDGTKEVTK